MSSIINSKLIKGLESLDSIQVKHFDLFVQSPYHNTNKEVIRLIKFLRKQSNLTSKNLMKRNVFTFLFKRKKFNDKLLRNIMSKSFLLLEQFLINEKIRESNLSTIETLSQWREKKAYEIAEKSSNILQQNLKKSNLRNLNYFNVHQKIEEERYLTALNHGVRNIDTNLKALIETIDLKFIYQKLKVSCELLNRNKVLSKDLKLSLFQPVLDYLEKNPDIRVPAIDIYYNVVLLLLEDDTTHFNELKVLLNRHSNLFEKEEAHDMYGYLNNFCIQRVNKGEEQYLVELFNLYKELLTKEILIDQGIMNLFDYKNIATVSLRLKEFDWAEGFTKKYASYLHREFQSSAEAYNIARIKFYNADYRGALRELLDVDYADIYYELGCRSLLLKIHYEQNDFELFEATSQSFRLFLTRNKDISEYQYNIYLNFIKYTKKLFIIKSGNRRSLKPITEKLRSIKNVADLTWVLEKLSALN